MKRQEPTVDQPQITITRLDAERLEHLLESLPDGTFPVKEQLQAEIARADIVDSRDVPPDVVTMNSTVRFRVENNEREFSLRLVYPKDADGSPDKVSVLAPVGSALLGIRQGQGIAWPMPGGATARVEVIRVEDQPERSGNYAL
jgi:regulator of nucleoside diphosphate kinase